VTCTFYLVAHDEKRFHAYQELRHADGWLAATAEGLTLHVDQSGPKVAPMPAQIQQALADYQAAQGPLPEEARIGRRIGFKR
jgi:acyl-CoA thioester hydrolase